MRNDRFSRELHREMADVHVSPSLRKRTLDAVYEREQVVVKKKISFAMAAAMMAVMVCTVALAVTGSAGLQDFFGRYVNTFVPAQMGQQTQNNVSYAANDLVSVSVRELYYDGRTAHMTVDVTPKGQGVLLLNANIGMISSWPKLITVDDTQVDPADTRTIADAYAQLGYTQAYRVNMEIYNEKRENVGNQMDYVLGEDGTLTYYMEAEFGTDEAERIAQLDVMLVPYTNVQQNPTALNWAERTVLEHRFRMTAAEYAFEAYICDTPTVFAGANVCVNRLLIEVRPQELLYTIDYTFLHPEQYGDDAPYVWFDFVERPEDGKAAYALMDGVNTSSHSYSDGVSGCQTGTLGRNELRETYTLNANDDYQGTRYVLNDFLMRPATYEEVEALTAEMADRAPIMPGVTATPLPTPMPETNWGESEWIQFIVPGVTPLPMVSSTPTPLPTITPQPTPTPAPMKTAGGANGFVMANSTPVGMLSPTPDPARGWFATMAPENTFAPSAFATPMPEQENSVVTYLCDEPVTYAEANVRVDHLVMVDGVFGVSFWIDCTLLPGADPENWPYRFEFVDPADPSKTLAYASTSDGFFARDGRILVQAGTLEKDALNHTYLLRIYNGQNAVRGETRAFTVRPVEQFSVDLFNSPEALLNIMVSIK